MANQADLDRLTQGVPVWNQWREANPGIQPNLSQADLIGADLREANFHGTNFVWTRLGGARLDGANLSHAELTGADLSDTDLLKANLSQANLSNANLVGADLREANLNRANLRRTDLIGAKLVGATLRGASLYETDLSGADLDETDLRCADLLRTNLSEASLIRANLGWATLRETTMREADLSQARLGYTVFADVNLSVVQRLEEANHYGPSTLGIDTLSRSQGRLPEQFLRGAGVFPLLLDSAASTFGKAERYATCLISYARQDYIFTERLCIDLQRKGVRCWLLPKDDERKEPIQSDLDEPLHSYDQLLLVLSEHSVQSVWIAQEVQTAFEQEAQLARRVLFPIRLDDSVLLTKVTWATDLRRIRQIGDFRAWKQHERYQETLSRLFRDLNEGVQQHITEV